MVYTLSIGESIQVKASLRFPTTDHQHQPDTLDNMPSFIDLTRQKFNRLTVVSRALNKGKRTFWNVKCICGVEKIVRGDQLQDKSTKSCGCLNIEKMKIRDSDGNCRSMIYNLLGKRFGRLLILKRVYNEKGKDTKWLCKCDCGNEITTSSTLLRDGRTKSCGCLRNEVSTKHCKDMFFRGMSTISHLVREIARYKEWRTAVFERDNYTCQGCFKKGGKLNADHIEPFSLLLLKNKILSSEQAAKCENLWFLDNGRTLCLQCHFKTETYGAKSNKIILNYLQQSYD
jgi:hypothetical protein